MGSTFALLELSREALCDRKGQCLSSREDLRQVVLLLQRIVKYVFANLCTLSLHKCRLVVDRKSCVVSVPKNATLLQFLVDMLI